MERRNWSLEALEKLQYIDSLDDEIRGKSLESWSKTYLQSKDFLLNLDFTQSELEKFSELFYKNINFLKEQKTKIQQDLKQTQNIKKFFN